MTQAVLSVLTHSGDEVKCVLSCGCLAVYEIPFVCVFFSMCVYVCVLHAIFLILVCGLVVFYNVSCLLYASFNSISMCFRMRLLACVVLAVHHIPSAHYILYFLSRDTKLSRTEEIERGYHLPWRSLVDRTL